jgi:hypothetical protein
MTQGISATGCGRFYRNQVTTRDVYPGHPPKYCLKCSPRKKRKDGDTRPPEQGDFVPTHNLVDSTGKVTPVALEAAPEKGWFFVRTALDLIVSRTDYVGKPQQVNGAIA